MVVKNLHLSMQNNIKYYKIRQNQIGTDECAWTKEKVK